MKLDSLGSKIMKSDNSESKVLVGERVEDGEHQYRRGF